MAVPLPHENGNVSMSIIERSLGFWWPHGLSRAKGRMNYPVIKDLLKDLDILTCQYTCYLSPPEIETS